ncbi:MAG: hypothetical protein AAFX79_04575 [Planctomycetota bacterium]
MSPLLTILALVLIIPAAIIAIIYAFKALAFVLRKLGGFIVGELSDILRILGVLITVPILSILVVANIVIAHWSKVGHYGRGVSDEIRTLGAAIYRVLIGHPAELLCLTPLTEGFERRIPDLMAAAPGPDKPSRRVGRFDGYEIVGSLPGGGSGGKLYIAVPDASKRAAFERRGIDDVEKVVIKAFGLGEGSSLPQIVRESRSLDSAKKLGLVLEHELTEGRFHYVMRYAPGESLTRLTQRLHAVSGNRGLTDANLDAALGYTADLLETLSGYHAGGLWHKDVKPDNVIVDGDKARLVDFGLITHLRSAMTLTTHGTEYFRDPEMVRMALRGVKVNEVDGAKFDVYAVGAVLYSVVENSFPAHGGLSQISQRCPESVRWIVRRAMTDYDKRYRSADEMLQDVRFVLAADDAFAVKPAQLPSMRGTVDAVEHASAEPEARAEEPVVQRAAYAPPADESEAPAQPAKGRSRVRMLNWWTGSFAVDDAAPAVQASAAPAEPVVVARAATPVSARKTAREQVADARGRARATQRRAHDRRVGRVAHGAPPRGKQRGGGFGIGLAIVLIVMPVIGVGLLVLRPAMDRANNSFYDPYAPQAAQEHASAQGPRSAPSPAAILEHFASSKERLDGTLLVVRDATALSPESRHAIETRLSALRQAGVEVLDLHDAARKDQDTIGAMIADLRRTLGLKDLRSTKGWDAAKGWVAGQKKTDGVYWIAASEADPNVPEPRLIVRGERGKKLASAIRSLEAD